jgi:uncharacterized membrane protein YcgQ (UPF0703/DUF1980 family)
MLTSSAFHLDQFSAALFISSHFKLEQPLKTYANVDAFLLFLYRFVGMLVSFVQSINWLSKFVTFVLLSNKKIAVTPLTESVYFYHIKIVKNLC